MTDTLRERISSEVGDEASTNDEIAGRILALPELAALIEDAQQWVAHRDLCLEASARSQRERYDLEAHIAALTAERDSLANECGKWRRRLLRTSGVPTEEETALRARLDTQAGEIAGLRTELAQVSRQRDGFESDCATLIRSRDEMLATYRFRVDQIAALEATVATKDESTRDADQTLSRLHDALYAKDFDRANGLIWRIHDLLRVALASTPGSQRERREAEVRLAALLQGAHYVDIVVRRNGRDEHHEGDFLRALAVLADPGDTPPTLGLSENVQVRRGTDPEATS